MLTLDGIQDLEMEDGTTGFAIALPQLNIGIMGAILRSNIRSDIDPIQLLIRAVEDLSRESDEEMTEFKDQLVNLLEEHTLLQLSPPTEDIDTEQVLYYIK